MAGLAYGQGFFVAVASPTPVAVASSTPAVSPTIPTTSSPIPASAAPAPTSTAAPSATPTPVGPLSGVPIVPVVSFWSGVVSITTGEVIAAAKGADKTYSAVVVPDGMSSAISGALGLRSGKGLVEMTPAALEVAVNGGALGLLPLPDVTPTVHALALDGMNLFGNDRVKSLEAWPLSLPLESSAGTWDTSQTWTLVAGGDVVLDRGTARTITILGGGVDFPWDGGTVVITGHHCCTPFGWPVTEFRQTGNAGAVRQLFRGADISMANLEGPVKNAFVYHASGFTFTGDPRDLNGLQDAGIDFVNLANNHIGNGGVVGLGDTINALDARGIAHAGAGANLAAAAQPASLSAGGQTVAVIGCAEVGGFNATDTTPGDLKCRDPAMLKAIAAARAKASVVIVFAHWGIEYRTDPTVSQRRLAASWAAAGATLILGSHPHWVEAIDDINGTFAFYSLGNLVFDQDWSENTMEGLIVELTFQGPRLVQAWLHPTLILSQAQPNLLEYDSGGSDVLARIRDASGGLAY